MPTDTAEIMNIKMAIGQINQVLEQYRSSIYNMELRMELLVKMLGEKGVMATGEFDTRWPQFLKNDVGVVGQDGVMQGSLKTTFY